VPELEPVPIEPAPVLVPVPVVEGPVEPVVSLPKEPVVDVPLLPVVDVPVEPVVDVPVDPVVEAPVVIPVLSEPPTEETPVGFNCALFRVSVDVSDGEPVVPPVLVWA